MFYCPGTDHLASNPAYSLSYNYNQHIGRPRAQLGQLPDPIATLMVIDAVYRDVEPYTNSATSLGQGHTQTIRISVTSMLTRGQFIYRHNRLTHALFADGHVDARPLGPMGYPAGIRMEPHEPPYPWP